MRCFPFSPPRAIRCFIRGFSLIELVVTVVILSVIGFTVLPKFGDVSIYKTMAAEDKLLAKLRELQKTAVGSRRTVCVQLSKSTLGGQPAVTVLAKVISNYLDSKTEAKVKACLTAGVNLFNGSFEGELGGAALSGGSNFTVDFYPNGTAGINQQPFTTPQVFTISQRTITLHGATAYIQQYQDTSK